MSRASRWSIGLFAGLAFIFFGIFAPQASAQSDVGFGVQVGYGNDLDLGIGGRVTADLNVAEEGSFFEELRGIVDFIYYLDPGDCDDVGGTNIDCSAWELSANGAIPIQLGESDTDFYVGAGLTYWDFSVDADTGFGNFGVSDSGIGLNVLGGLNFGLGALNAFAEANLRISGSEQFVIMGGIAL